MANLFTIKIMFFFVLIAFGTFVEAQTTIFSDDFDDGSFSPPFTVDSGSWSAASFYLRGSNFAGGSIYASLDMNTNVSNNTYVIEYQDYIEDPGIIGTFSYLTDDTGILSQNSGYSINLDEDNITIVEERTSTTLLNESFSPDLSTTSFHNIKVIHNYLGGITLYFNGELIGVTNSTDTNGNKIFFGTQGGVGFHRFDNVEISVYSDSNNLFQIVDENFSSGIDANLSINGKDWLVDDAGFFDVNSDIVFPATFVVSNSDYDTRTFVFDSNESLYDIRKLGIRKEAEAKDISFQFFEPDQTTILSNRWINVYRNSVLSGRAQTDSSGKAIFNLAPQDSVYDFNIFSANTSYGDTNVQYSYDSVSVTINGPRDESDNSLINSPGGFNIDVGGLGLQTISGQTVFPFSTIFILGNTEDVYTLRVQDSNTTLTQYFARHYILQTKGDDSSLTITPYLIDADEGILVNLKIIDLATNLTVNGVRTTLSTGINNASVVVEDRLSNILGVAQVVMLQQKDYTLNVTNSNQTIRYFTNQTISPTSSNISIYINASDTNESYSTQTINVKLTPTGDTLSGTTATIDFNITTNFDINLITVKAWDGNIVREQTTSTISPFLSSLTLTLSEFTKKNPVIEIIVTDEDQNTTLIKSYFIFNDTNKGFYNLTNLAQDFDVTNFLIIFGLAIIGLVAWTGNGLFGNNDAQIFPIAIASAGIVYVFFQGYFLVFMGALLAGGVAWIWSRSIR